jgi:uncharacterized protein YeaO (DUF488 family)
MIRHASVYELDQQSAADGLPVLVMRLWPRGVRRERIGTWLKDAAPSRELLDEYQHAGLPRQQFEERYRAEIVEQRPHVLGQLKQLEREHGSLILVCHERIPPSQYCHRLTLAELLARSG